MGCQPLPHVPLRLRGRIERLDGVCRQPFASQAPVHDAPSGEGLPPPASAQPKETVGRELLPLHFWPWRVRDVSSRQVKEDRSGRVLVVTPRAPAQVPPHSQAPGLCRPGPNMWKRLGRLSERCGSVTPSVRAVFGDQRACSVELPEGH